MEKKEGKSPIEEVKEKAVKCPVCGKESVKEYFPFCSKRCADIDLNRWFSGVYAFPSEEGDEEDGDERLPAAESEEGK